MCGCRAPPSPQSNLTQALRRCIESWNSKDGLWRMPRLSSSVWAHPASCGDGLVLLLSPVREPET